MNSLDEYFQSATGGSTYPPGGAHWRGTEGQSDSGFYISKHLNIKTTGHLYLNI